MTPEEWTHGLDLPNLLRYGTHEQTRGLITTAIREAVHEGIRETVAEQDKVMDYVLRKIVGALDELNHDFPISAAIKLRQAKKRLQEALKT